MTNNIRVAQKKRSFSVGSHKGDNCEIFKSSFRHYRAQLLWDSRQSNLGQRKVNFSLYQRHTFIKLNCDCRVVQNNRFGRTEHVLVWFEQVQPN